MLMGAEHSQGLGKSTHQKRKKGCARPKAQANNLIEKKKLRFICFL